MLHKYKNPVTVKENAMARPITPTRRKKSPPPSPVSPKRLRANRKKISPPSTSAAPTSPSETESNEEALSEGPSESRSSSAKEHLD